MGNELDRSLTQPTVLVYSVSYVTNRSRQDELLGLKIGAANRLDLPKLKVVPTVCSDSFLALL